jgi:hypothetical protein
VPKATVELNSSEIQAPIISRYGCIRIQWDSAELSDTLTQLRHERAQYQRAIENSIGEAASNHLIAEAETIKADTTQHIQTKE